MGRYKIFYDCDHYFITCTIVKWISIFTDDRYFDVIINSFKYCQQYKGLLLYFYVIMKNHLHAIIKSENDAIPDIMRDFKRFTSKSITQLLLKDKRCSELNIFSKKAVKNRINSRYKVWQNGYHPKALESESMFNQKIEYIHMNPVIKGYVNEPEKWKYSSARNIYLNDNSVIKLDELE